MTGTREPQQDGSIHAMLRDSGLEGSTELRGALDELRALVPDLAPAPRADVAALLAAGAHGRGAHGSAAGASPVATITPPTAAVSAPEHTDEALPAGVASLAERRGRKRRLAVVGGAVVGAMTLGAGAVAASSENFRESVSSTVGVLFHPSGGTPDIAPRPAGPSPADIPPAPVPVPAEAVPAEQPPEAPEVPAASPAAPAPGATPPAVGRGGVLPTPPRRPVTPGIPGVGDGRNIPVKPLPAPTLPGVEPIKVPGPGGIIGDE
ncbi:MAG: hypothetical protein ABWX85_00535 [Arthrobacter sp.]